MVLALRVAIDQDDRLRVRQPVQTTAYGVWVRHSLMDKDAFYLYS